MCVDKSWQYHHANNEQAAKKIYDHLRNVKGKDARYHKSQRGGWTVKERG